MENTNKIISHASPHTIKKFELIEKYVHSWAHKLLQVKQCSGLVFIDCMSNSGEYVDDDNNHIFGTPVRIAKYLRDIATQYPNKQIDLFFSDISIAKTSHLKKLVPSDSSNFHCHISTEDGNELVMRLGTSLTSDKHYLLVYDPYDANINWNVIVPFINNWSEIIINHMVSDSMRAIKMAKKESTKSKYENTYLTKIKNLIPYGSDRTAYEKRIEYIISKLRKNKYHKYYIAAFPFFNGKNAIVYNLIHCTNNIKGFRLFKESAWKTFGGKSSTKNTHGSENQLVLNFYGDETVTTYADESCFYVTDIASYIQKIFKGKLDVPLDDIWAQLDNHPIFPSDGFRMLIKKELQQYFGATINKKTISFTNRS